MIRALALVIKAGVLIAVVVFLSDLATTGAVAIDYGGYLVETTPGILVAGIIMLYAVLMMLSSFLGFIANLPRRWRGYRAEVARDDAYRALTQGLVAVAGNELHHDLKTH